MKIILSPTKTMKLKDLSFTDKSYPYFIDESDYLRGLVKTFDKAKIKDYFKVSDKLVLSIYNYYHNDNDLNFALNLYDGLVFKYLDSKTLNAKQLAYLKDHTFILSSLYGVLRVNDLISEYRLDYNMKFDINLYDFWYDKLTNYFKDFDVIINLASNEFSKSFAHPNMINIIFLNQQLKALSTNVKMARGDFLRFIVLNNIEDKEELKTYSNLDYKFNEEKSDENNYYFIKE